MGGWKGEQNWMEGEGAQPHGVVPPLQVERAGALPARAPLAA